MISSPLMDGPYERLVPNYEEYRSQKIIVDITAAEEPVAAV